MERIRKIVQFLGVKVTAVMIASIPLGVACMLAELGFAVCLQCFLVVLKVADPAVLSLPGWWQHRSDLFVLSALLTLAVIRALLLGISTYLNSLVPELFSSIQRSRLLSWTFFSRSASSSWVNTLYGNEVSNACSAITSLQMIALQGALLLGLAVGLLNFSVKISLLSFILFPVLGLSLKYFEKRLRVDAQQMQKEWLSINQRLLMGIKNLLMLRICGVENQEHDRAQAHLRKFLSHLYHSLKIAAFMSAFPQLFGIVGIIVLTLVSNRYGWLKGGATLTYFYLLMRFIQNASGITLSFASYTRCSLSFQTLARWWAEHAHDGVRGQARYAKEERIIELKPEVPLGWTLKDIGFSYGEDHRNLFKSFNLEIQPGNSLVVQGPSGTGKSTLLALLLDEISPTSGTVTIRQEQNAYPLSTVKRSVLRRIGYVGPESFLIDGSIRENLLYGLTSEEPSEERIREALKRAGCQFVFELPNGLAHLITEQGQGLSAGQKQRVSLARALLRNPLALVLDEATSNLDLDTEAAILETLNQLRGRITQIIVTHRDTALKIADQVLKLPIS